jgi:hypothetical protein
VRQRFELVAMQLPVEARAGSSSVVQRDLARALEGTGCGNAHEDSFERSAGERLAHELVLLRSQEERQRRCAVAKVGAGDLAGLDRRAGAVEDVVGDLKGHAERDAVVARAAAEPARCLEKSARLQGAALEVGLDGRRRIVRLRALQRLSAREPERGMGEHVHGRGIACPRELREGAGEQIVPGRARGRGPVHRPRCRLAATEVRAVDQVVVDESRHVNELDGDTRGERRLETGRRRQEDE